MTQVWISTAALLPTLLTLAGVVLSYKKRRNKLLRLAPRVIFWLMIPAILIGALDTALFLHCVPLQTVPATTWSWTWTWNLMPILWQNCSRNRFLNRPSPAPYHYQKYSSLFSDSMLVECSFRLTDDEYDVVKVAALESRCFRASNEKGAGSKPDAPFAATAPSGTISTTIYPENLTVAFTYDDESHTVHYQAEIEQKH